MIAVIVVLALLVALRIDFGGREDAVLKYFSQEQGMRETFDRLENLTLPGSVILCWWDYGRAVREWSHREVIEAYPSRDIWYSMASSRDPLHSLETQIFGTWGSSEKIHDMARIFLQTEEQALQTMSSYDVAYALVFVPDELQKFNWIAQIAGFDGADYLAVNGTSYEPTEAGSQTTLLRLAFDEALHPARFTKLFDNGRGKIFQVNY